MEPLERLVDELRLELTLIDALHWEAMRLTSARRREKPQPSGRRAFEQVSSSGRNPRSVTN